MMEIDTAFRIFATGLTMCGATLAFGLFAIGDKKLEKAVDRAFAVSISVVFIGVFCMIWSY